MTLFLWILCLKEASCDLLRQHFNSSSKQSNYLQEAQITPFLPKSGILTPQLTGKQTPAIGLQHLSSASGVCQTSVMCRWTQAAFRHTVNKMQMKITNMAHVRAFSALVPEGKRKSLCCIFGGCLMLTRPRCAIWGYLLDPSRDLFTTEARSLLSLLWCDAAVKSTHLRTIPAILSQ